VLSHLSEDWAVSAEHARKCYCLQTKQIYVTLLFISVVWFQFIIISFIRIVLRSLKLFVIAMYFTYLLTYGAESFLRSCQLCSHSGTSQNFKELEGSSPCSQEPSTGPYPEPNRSSPYHPIPSHPISLRSILILSTHLCYISEQPFNFYSLLVCCAA
jgi:hypothetical protein